VQVVVKDIFMLVLLHEEQEKGAFAVIRPVLVAFHRSFMCINYTDVVPY
jgi:hypothetical protein